MRRRIAWLGIVALASGCASSPALVAARRGDFGALKADVEAREKAGTLGNAEAADLAHAVAAWDVTHPAKPGDAVLRVSELRACAREVDGILADRMKTHDAAGGEAALARVESGAVGLGSARDHESDTGDEWRAVGARGLVREDDGDARRKAYLDPAPAVRRAAMHAGAVALDPRDVDTLAEAARVDPEPIVRTDAVRTLGAIGGAAVVGELRDLWASGDEPLREDIAAAWARPVTWSAGGREALRVVVAQGEGPGAIEGAGAVLREEAGDAEMTASAVALLTRSIARASSRDRLHAIALVPPRPPPALLDALRAAKNDSDLTVRVAVLARLLDSAPDPDRAAALRDLETIAAPSAVATSTPAPRARLALAQAGDARVQAWLEADLAAPEPAVRLGAAMALAALGRPARAAPLLTDADPSVRTRAACTLLTARARH